CQRGVRPISASTTTRSSVSWDLARRTSMPCAQAAPYRKPRNAPPSRSENTKTTRQTMSDINTERSAGILRVEINRPEKKNALTAAMYSRLADIFNEAAKDEETQVVLWHGAGDVFSAGNDLVDFLKNPPGPGRFPQGSLMDAFIRFEKPIVAAVQGAAI